MAGCHTDTNSPVTPGIGRIAQDMHPLGNWSEYGYSIDSASSMYVHHLDPNQNGDLAYTDTVGGEPVVPIATAFVKANQDTQGPGSVIRFAAWQTNLTPPYYPNYQVSLAMDLLNENYCRHPSVEVVYVPANGGSEGYLGFHIVWSQWRGPSYPDEGNWELFYKFIYFPVTSGGIQWGSAVGVYDPIEPIDFPSSNELDEIQPDLSVDAENGSLLVVFTQTDEPYNSIYNIIVVQGVIHATTPAFWNPSPYFIVSGPQESEKGFPKIDVGRINTDPANPLLMELRAVAVWSEWDPGLENFQVWYTEADPTNQPLYVPGMQITFSVNGDTYESWDFLPSVDIPAPSSASNVYANMQAVICYESSDVVRIGQNLTFNEQRVNCRITPALGQEFLIMGDDNHEYADLSEARVPEVACYQMNDLFAEQQWFGVAMHASCGDIITGEIFIYTGAWTYNVDEYGGVHMALDPISYWYEDDPDEYGYWSYKHPATGPTISLRYTTPLWEPLDQRFGIGWIDGDTSPSAVEVAQGTIAPS